MSVSSGGGWDPIFSFWSLLPLVCIFIVLLCCWQFLASGSSGFLLGRSWQMSAISWWRSLLFFMVQLRTAGQTWAESKSLPYIPKASPLSLHLSLQAERYGKTVFSNSQIRTLLRLHDVIDMYLLSMLARICQKHKNIRFSLQKV